jgi:hypothetical protein
MIYKIYNKKTGEFYPNEKKQWRQKAACVNSLPFPFPSSNRDYEVVQYELTEVGRTCANEDRAHMQETKILRAYAAGRNILKRRKKQLERELANVSAKL